MNQTPPHHTKRRWIKAAAILVLILAVAIPLAGYVALTNMDTERLRQYLQQQVREKTGRELYIKGEMEVAFGLTPSVQLSQVALANPAWAKNDALFYADAVGISFELLPLLHKELVIEEVSTQGARLALEKSKSGKTTWQFEQKSAAASKETPEKETSTASEGSGFTMRLGPVVLRDTHITYLDHAKDTPLTVTLPILKAQTEEDVHLMAELRIEEFSGEITMEGAPLAEFLQKPVLIDATLQGPRGSDVSFKGKATDITTAPQLYARAEAKTDSLAAFSPLAGSTLPETERIEFSSDINGTPKELELENLQAAYAQSQATGKARISLGGARPFISATLNIPNYQIKSGTSPAPATAQGDSPASAPAVSEEKRVIPAIDFPTGALSAVNADIEFTVGEIATPKLTLNSVMGHLVLKSGILQIDPLQFKLADDLIKGSVAYNTSITPPGMRLTFSTAGQNLGAFLQALDITQKMEGGNFTATLDIKGQGGGLRAMMPQLEGEASLVVENAVLKDPKLQGAAEFANLLQGKSRSGDVALTCALGNITIKEGIGTPQYLVADTKQVRLLGEGSFDLPQELLALTFYPQPKQAGLAELSLPVKLKGNFANPEIKVDRTQAAFSAAKLFSGSKKLRGLEALLGKGEANQGKDVSGLHPCLEPIDTPQATGNGTPAPDASDVVDEKKEDIKKDFKTIEKDVRGLRDGLKGLLNK